MKILLTIFFEILERSLITSVFEGKPFDLQNSPALFSSILIDIRITWIIRKYHSKNFFRYWITDVSSKAFESISPETEEDCGARVKVTLQRSLSARCVCYWKVTLKKFYLRIRSLCSLISRYLASIFALATFFQTEKKKLFSPPSK